MHHIDLLTDRLNRYMNSDSIYNASRVGIIHTDILYDMYNHRYNHTSWYNDRLDSITDGTLAHHRMNVLDRRIRRIQDSNNQMNSNHSIHVYHHNVLYNNHAPRISMKEQYASLVPRPNHNSKDMSHQYNKYINDCIVKDNIDNIVNHSIDNINNSNNQAVLSGTLDYRDKVMNTQLSKKSDNKHSIVSSKKSKMTGKSSIKDNNISFKKSKLSKSIDTKKKVNIKKPPIEEKNKSKKETKRKAVSSMKNK